MRFLSCVISLIHVRFLSCVISLIVLPTLPSPSSAVFLKLPPTKDANIQNFRKENYEQSHGFSQGYWDLERLTTSWLKNKSAKKNNQTQVCVCVRACVRACVRVCVRACACVLVRVTARRVLEQNSSAVAAGAILSDYWLFIANWVQTCSCRKILQQPGTGHELSHARMAETLEIVRKKKKSKRHRKKNLRRPGIEPGSTAWKAAMLTTIPPTPLAGVQAQLCLYEHLGSGTY